MFLVLPVGLSLAMWGDSVLSSRGSGAIVVLVLVLRTWFPSTLPRFVGGFLLLPGGGCCLPARWSGIYVYICLLEILVGPCVWVNLLDSAAKVISDGVVESLIVGVVVGVACCLTCVVHWVHRMTCRLLIQGVFVSWCSLVCCLIRL